MARDATLYNMLRNHDQTIYDWLNGLTIDYGTVKGIPFPSKSILKVYAAPKRAFASMRHVLVRKGWIDDVGSTPGDTGLRQAEFRNVPLPFASIYRSDPALDFQRSGSPLVWNRFTTGCAGTVAYGHPYPVPYDLSYQIDFWALKKYTEAYIYEWIFSKIGVPGSAPNEIMMYVNHGPPWGIEATGFRVESWSDTSDIEDIEEETRMLRFTMQGMFKARVFLPPKELGKTVLVIGGGFCDQAIARESVHFGAMPPITINLLTRRKTRQNPYVQFDHTKTVGSLVSKSPRIYTLSGKDASETSSFQVIFASSSDYVETKILPALPNGPTSISGAIYALAGEPPINVEFRDVNDLILHRITINIVKDGWYQFESLIPVYVEPGVKVRIFPDAPGKYQVDNLFIELRHPHLVGLELALSPTETFTSSILGDGVNHLVSGLKNGHKYLLTANVLTLSGDFAIIMENNDTLSTYAEEFLCVNGVTRVVGVFITPKNTGSGDTASLNYRIERRGTGPATIQLGDISLRQFDAPTKGNHAPS